MLVQMWRCSVGPTNENSLSCTRVKTSPLWDQPCLPNDGKRNMFLIENAARAWNWPLTSTSVGNFYNEMYNPLELYECKILIWTEVNPVHFLWVVNFPFVSKFVGTYVIGIWRFYERKLYRGLQKSCWSDREPVWRHSLRTVRYIKDFLSTLHKKGDVYVRTICPVTGNVPSSLLNILKRRPKAQNMNFIEKYFVILWITCYVEYD